MLIANKTSRFVSLFVTILLILAGATFIQLSSPATAHAAPAVSLTDDPCATTGQCQEISTNVALSYDAGAGGGALTGGGFHPPVSTGGGGTASAPKTPQTCFSSLGWCADKYITKADFQYMGTNWNGAPLANCGVKTVSGIKVHPIGFTTVYIAYLLTTATDVQLGGDGARYSEWRFLSQVCNYPPDPTYVESNVKCILSYNASIDRLANSYLGYGAGVARKSQTVSTIASLESDPRSCQRSMTASFGTNLGRSQADYGWYKATSQVTWANCNFGTITFNGVGTRVGGCSYNGTKLGSVGKLTVYCGPAIRDWVQFDWTGKDCYSFGPKCTAPNNSTFNGFTGNVQALRDGNDNSMNWANPKFTAGISNAQNWRTKTDINGGSTPYNTGAGANDKTNQLFRSNQNFGTWNAGALATLQKQTLAFYTAGSSGSPFSMTRNYLFDANFTTVATTITGYNLTTGAISTGNSSTTVFLKNNPCGPQTSPNINAVRAIGDVITK